MKFLRLFLVAACLAATGCGTTVHAYDVHDAHDEHSQWDSFFLFGAVGEAEVDIPKTCGPDRPAASMGVGHNVFTVLATIATLGIYSPRMAYVSCGESQ